MAITFLDPAEARQARAAFVTRGGTCDERPTEMWEGVEVVPPVPNTEHFRFASILNSAFSSVIDWDRGDMSLPGGNVSDRDQGWTHNYRNPDVLVVLAGGRAIDLGAHWQGGPDLVVEIISPGENSAAKFAFYAGIGTREVLIVDRDPWSVELFQLRGGTMISAGRSDAANPAAVASSVLPLSFRLAPGRDRPVVEVTHAVTGQVWKA